MDFSPTAQNDKKWHFAHNKKMQFFTQNDSPCTMRFLKFTQTRLYKVLCWLLTLNFVSIAWVFFFRTENLQGALNLLKTMFGVDSVAAKMAQNARNPSTNRRTKRHDFYILISIMDIKNIFL